MIRRVPAFALRYLMARTWMSVVAVCLAGTVAMWAWAGLDGLHFEMGVSVLWALEVAQCDTSSFGGASIELADTIVSCGAIALVIGVALFQYHPRRLASLLGAGALMLCVGIGLVAADAATHSAEWPCGVASPLFLLSRVHIPLVGSVSGVSWLFALWGVTLALVALRAFGAWKGVEQPTRRRRYRTPRAWQTGA